jgi:hypothetical protein
MSEAAPDGRGDGFLGRLDSQWRAMPVITLSRHIASSQRGIRVPCNSAIAGPDQRPRAARLERAYLKLFQITWMVL